MSGVNFYKRYTYMYSSQFTYRRAAQELTRCSNGEKGDKGDTGTNGINGLSGSRGNVALVDTIYGNDTTASVGGLPFKTITSALSVIQSGQQIHVYPGTYYLSSTITLPTNVVLQGTPPCTLGYTATSSTTFLTMGETSRLDNFSIVIHASSHVNLTGILFPNTTTSTAQVTNVHLTMNNVSAGVLGTSDVLGINCNGTGNLLNSSFSWNAIQNSTINVQSNGGGIKRGILVSGRNVVSTRDTNIYIAGPSTTSWGSYVGVETNDGSTFQTGSIQLRTSSIGTVQPSAGQTYTASDILQTTPTIIISPTYLASAGIQIGPGTDLVTKTAGNNGFSTFNYPTVLVYGLKGTLYTNSNHTTGYLWYGTQQVLNDSFPDSNTTFPAYFRIQQPAILSGLSGALAIAPSNGCSIIITVRYTPTGQTTPLDTLFTITLSGTTREAYFYNRSLSLNAGDKVHVYLEITGGNANLAHDLTVQLDLF